jgi:hypothetical protein
MLFDAGLRQRATIAREDGSPALPADQVNATSWRRFQRAGKAPVGSGDATLEDGQWPHSFCSCWRWPAGWWWPTWSGRTPPPASQVTVFGQTVGGYPEGWLLAIAAGLGFAAALLLVASLNSTKGRRARRKQLRGLRQGLEDQVVAPEPDHARLLGAFFGPEEPSRHFGGPARPADPRGEGPESRADDNRRWVTARPIQHPAEPLYQRVRSAQVRGTAGRAERNMISAGSPANWSSIPPSRSTSRPAGRWAGPGRGPPSRGQPGAQAVAVPVEVRGGKKQQATHWSPAA